MVYKNTIFNWGRFHFVAGDRLSNIMRIFFLVPKNESLQLKDMGSTWRE